MSKEEIKAAIAEKIAGQGNQLDLSGSLDGILQEIVDIIPDPTPAPEGPLVIEGEIYYDDAEEASYVKPKDNTITFGSLVADYKKGRTIVVFVHSTTIDMYATVVGIEEEGWLKLALTLYNGEDSSSYIFY